MRQGTSIGERERNAPQGRGGRALAHAPQGSRLSAAARIWLDTVN
jgi:hypothetical protein